MAFIKVERVHVLKRRKPISELAPVMPVDLNVPGVKGEFDSVSRTVKVTVPLASVKVASKKRAIRIMVNAQRELLKDNKANKHVPDLINVVKERSLVDYTGLVCSSDKNGVRTYHAMPDRPRSPELYPVDFDETREVIAQRIIRHNKAAPQRKRKTK